MIWLAALLIILIPLVIWALLVQEETLAERRRSPMGWLRRLWARPQPDRRRCNRYRAAIPVTYRVLTSPVPAVQTKTRDLSFSGVGIVLYEKLATGTQLELTLQAAPPVGFLTVQGVVQWVREVPQQAGDPKRLFWAGVQLTHTGTTSLDQLRTILSQISPDGRQGRI